MCYENYCEKYALIFLFLSVKHSTFFYLLITIFIVVEFNQ